MGRRGYVRTCKRVIYGYGYKVKEGEEEEKEEEEEEEEVVQRKQTPYSTYM